MASSGVGFGSHLANAVLGLNGPGSGWLPDGAVDGGRDVLRQAERAVDRDLVDQEAVLAERVAQPVTDLGDDLRLSGAVDVLDEHSRPHDVERLAHGVTDVAVREK